MEIRKAEISDAANIGAVGMCVWVDTYATEGVYKEIAKYVFAEFVEEKIAKIIEKKTVFVVSNGYCILGYIVVSKAIDSQFEIETLYILPKFQGQGIGKQLIQIVKEAIGKALWLSVWELNHNAIAFYKKLGFRETGEVYFDLYGNKIRNIVLETSI